jgi:hypothetical protein
MSYRLPAWHVTATTFSGGAGDSHVVAQSSAASTPEMHELSKQVGLAVSGKEKAAGKGSPFNSKDGGHHSKGPSDTFLITYRAMPDLTQASHYLANQLTTSDGVDKQGGCFAESTLVG